jgi:hypothetical protein
LPLDIELVVFLSVFVTVVVLAGRKVITFVGSFDFSFGGNAKGGAAFSGISYTGPSK